MSRLEELPDDLDEQSSLDRNLGQDASIDDLFDQAMKRGGLTNKTFEEAMLDMSKTPLFMNSAEDLENGGEMLEALQALQYEGTKSEVAQNFKEQGNDCVATKQWLDAKEFYTKGLAVLLDKDEDKWDKPNNTQEEANKRQILMEQLYSNRARCNLELKNYRSTTQDCAATIRLNPTNAKAHYRSATALLALDKIYEALDVCYRGLKSDPQNSAMKALLEKIQKRSRVKEQQDARRREEQLRKRKEKMMLATALRARGIKVRGTMSPPNMADAAVRLSPDPLSPESTLEIPVMLLYPMDNQSDFIKAYGEKEALIDHLTYILPLPWDDKNWYRKDTIDCFMDTTTGGLMKVGKKLMLLELLSNDKIEVVDGLVRIHVVPQDLAPRWIDELRKKRG